MLNIVISKVDTRHLYTCILLLYMHAYWAVWDKTKLASQCNLHTIYFDSVIDDLMALMVAEM